MIKEIFQYIISLPVLIYYKLKDLINPKEIQNNDAVPIRLSPGEIAVPRNFLNVEYVNNRIFGLEEQLNLHDLDFLERVTNVKDKTRKRRRVLQRSNKGIKKRKSKSKKATKATRKARVQL